MRYQAALRPEPLGSNTRTIASQPTIARMSFFFDEKPATTRPPLDHQNLRVSIFDRYLSGISAVCDLDLTPLLGQPHRACSRRSLLGNPQAASGVIPEHSKINLAAPSQLAKVVYLTEKWPKSRLPATTRRRKRKKSIMA
ncbi:MAG: hypothetical protein WB650_02775 [Candidatus Binatus sp.]